MNGFILRVKAYRGEPTQLDTHLLARESITLETPVIAPVFFNRDGCPCFLRDHDDEVMKIVEKFELAYECKVNIVDLQHKDGAYVYEFDVFEPSWRHDARVLDICGYLRDRLVAYIDSKSQS